MSDHDVDKMVPALEKIARIIAASYVHSLGDAEVGVKAERLSRCGFSNTEIAELLGTTPNSINVQLHRVRKQRSRGSKK